MAWEKRGRHARRYFYLSRRVGQKVRKVYMGSGANAHQSEQLDADARAERKRAREQERRLLAQYDAVAREIAEFSRYAELLARAVLIEAGFHRHKMGAWRRRRGRAD